MSYLIGQRVIVNGEICTVVAPPKGEREYFGKWVFVPSRGYASDYSLGNIKPLPNGQV